MWLQSKLCDRGNYEVAAGIVREVLNTPGIKDEVASNARYRLGVHCWNLGDKDSARKHMHYVVDYYPSTYWAKRARGMLYAWSLPVQKQ